MNREQAINYLRSSGYSEEQIRTIEGAFTCELIGCLTDRPCDVCRFKTENGCSRWECVFKGGCEMTREEAFNRIDAIIVKHEIDDVYVTITSFQDYDALRIARKELEQKPICPSAGIDCEDCPAYEDAISRKEAISIAGIATLSVNQVVTALKKLPSVSSSQKPKSEWERDHEILKAYSDGASAVLDKIREEIEQTEINGHIRDVECFRAGINVALNVIDKYMAEEGKE